MKRLICFSIMLVILLTGCHVTDIPFIGWRIDVARQQKAYREWHRKEYGEEPKIEQQHLLEEYSLDN